MPQYKLCVCDFIVIFVGDKYQLYLLVMAEDEEESIDSVVFFVVATRCVHVPRHQHYFFSRPTSSGKCNCSRTGRSWRFASSGRQGATQNIRLGWIMGSGWQENKMISFYPLFHGSSLESWPFSGASWPQYQLPSPCQRTNGSNVECNQYILYECNGSGLKSEWMVQ